MRTVMTFTGKVAGITVALGALVLLTAGSGLYTSSSLQHSFASIISREAKALELGGAIDTAAANTAAGERGLIMFAFTKDPARRATAQQLYRTSMNQFKKALAEIKPL